MVTVAIPVYNGEKFLEAAVKSIIGQTCGVERVIIIDDASEDSSPSIVLSLQIRFPDYNIVYYCNSNNIGYPSNWNKCFEYCKTKYLLILHQDDVLKENTIEILLSYMQANKEIALVGGYEDFIDKNGTRLVVNKPKSQKVYKKGEIYEFVRNHNSYVACSSVMFDMEKINQVGYFDTDVIGTDELFWPKVLSKFPIAVLGENLIYRRSHNDQTEFGDFVKFHNQARDIYEKFLRIADYEKRPELRKKILKILKFKFSKNWIGISTVVARRGHRLIAVKYIAKSVRLNPFIIFYFPRMWKSFAKVFLFSLGIRKNRWKI